MVQGLWWVCAAGHGNVALRRPLAFRSAPALGPRPWHRCRARGAKGFAAWRSLLRSGPSLAAKAPRRPRRAVPRRRKARPGAAGKGCGGRWRAALPQLRRVAAHRSPGPPPGAAAQTRRRRAAPGRHGLDPHGHPARLRHAHLEPEGREENIRYQGLGARRAQAHEFALRGPGHGLTLCGHLRAAGENVRTTAKNIARALHLDLHSVERGAQGHP
mmetsp:Transcript_56571/g.183939  ORF Transcript_56571/g.183939 Transcript_56571/m.183939 type:complete len:215 (-) Transcript_56571:361-1005(-)